LNPRSFGSGHLLGGASCVKVEEMRKIITLLAWTAIAALAQTGPSFEVASIKPSAPLDMGKMAAAVQSGQMPRIGPHIDGARAEYIYMSLKDLIVMAYKVKPFQVVGPDWMATQRFDIAATVPEGASSDDVPKCLQALLADRFKLVVRRETKEHNVLALVVGKGGPKLKASAEAPPPIDDEAPLKPGEMKMDTPDGKVRMTMDKTGGATVNMGAKGMMHYSMDPATKSLHLEASMVTMSGFADMLTQFSQMGGRGGRQVVDMTELKGHYEVSLSIPLEDLMNMARAAGMDVPGAPGRSEAAAGSPADAASDPSGSSTVFKAVQELGLKLETRKGMVEQIVVEHLEKSPTEN
jgi:uncharacterized protein (TIGR03435 family)